MPSASVSEFIVVAVPIVLQWPADGADDAALMAALGSDRLPPLPVVWRNSVEHDDMAALNELRATCPVQRDEKLVDLELALDLLHNSALYDRALRLAGEPTLTVSTEQSQTAQP